MRKLFSLLASLVLAITFVFAALASSPPGSTENTQLHDIYAAQFVHSDIFQSSMSAQIPLTFTTATARPTSTAFCDIAPRSLAITRATVNQENPQTISGVRKIPDKFNENEITNLLRANKSGFGSPPFVKRE